MLHVDVMDGHFVPNLTIGPPVVEAIRRHTDLYLDCHLMMDNPGEFLEAFAKAGANGCSVHVELGQTEALIAQLRDVGLDVGLAVNPETPFVASATRCTRPRRRGPTWANASWSPTTTVTSVARSRSSSSCTGSR